ncbi:hypothetical protein [Parasegetibacter sp. NRK P23]|uniref:LolA family protein n=1 Tax=Parasegetibacter sp. NRK P23 TaxID=2942999 RepID=UPI0020433C6F|nr:hypothetical protein [Parasegetibacter sp. NRK P23]MCM5529586.1 hypothetical protein [Parasegetibacter sp. NRK P23]
MIRILLFSLLLVSWMPGPAYIEKISASMVSRQVQMGKSVTIKGNIYYQRNGNMVTRFSYPKEYIVISNKVGEVKIYDPARNSVLQYQNFLFSTQSSQFYFFFSGKSADMGLGDIGFVQEKTSKEGNLVVTIWKLKNPDKKAAIQKVKLVYQQQQPVYMHYEDAAGKIIRKVFYYNYIRLENSSFPSITTEIVYGEKNDSTVSKTTYTDFKLNHQASNEYMDYRIPANAKIEK